MIVIGNAGIIEGDATNASEVDYTIFGLDSNALTFLANGQLASSKGTIYTANSTDVVSVIILVNAGTAHNHVNLYIKPTGGTSRRLIPKDFQLEPGYSLHFEGGKVQVISPTGVSGGGDPSYIMTFDNTSLSAGVLTVTHNFGHQYPGMPIVTDNSGKMIVPDEVTFTTANAFTVDLSSFGAITGTWRVVVLDSGASTAADAVSDTAYATSWDGITDVAPSKNAVYDALAGTVHTKEAVGFTIAGGTTSKTLTVGGNFTVNSSDSPTVDHIEELTSGHGVVIDGVVCKDGQVITSSGVTWNESADTYVRTGALAGYPVGTKPAESLLPIQAKMRRCVVANDGTVNYYLSSTNSAYKEDGITASVLDGTGGQVMVEIPKFWFRHTYAGTTHTWEISERNIAGFNVHPAFLSGPTELNYVYVGAYEGVLFDTSTGLYDSYASGDVIDFTATTGDVLSSVTGKKPVTNGTRANFRAIAANRGTGWTQLLYDVNSAIQLLYLVEYANFNTQTMVGLGICNVNDWGTYSYYPFAPTGNSNGIGNASGNTAGAVAGYAAEASKYVSYRGIEQWYGHLWKWLDGINTNNNRSYICNVSANLADDTASNYADIGVNNINSDGYQATLLNIARGFLPASVGASSSTKIGDYYYQAAGWRAAISGGAAGSGLDDGGFYLAVGDAAASAYAMVGSRLCYRK